MLIETIAVHGTIVDLLTARAQQDPQRPWVVFDGQVTTLADALAMSRRAASAFTQLGVRPGDRVVTLLGNQPVHLWSLLGLGMLNAIPVPLHFGTRGAQLRYYVDDTDPVAVVTTAANAGACREQIDPARTLLTTGGVAEDAIDLDGLVAASEPTPPATAPDPRDPFLIMYTSGTTGPSKGVIVPHSQPLRAAQYVATAFGFHRADRIFTAQPLFHAAALWWCCFAMLWSGGSVALASRFRAGTFWQEIADSGATSVKAVLAMLLQAEAAQTSGNPIPHHAARFVLATPVPVPAVQRRLEKRFGFQFASNYGMTELHAVAVRTPDMGVTKPGSVGRVCDHDEVAILDSHGEQLPAGSVGEIAVRPRDRGAMFTGYWRNDEATVRAWRDLWFHTGDLGRLDEDGFLWFAGRTKLAIRRKGENISTTEVEQVLLTHPAVTHCAVVGVPAVDGEHEVAAFVVLDTDRAPDGGPSNPTPDGGPSNPTPDGGPSERDLVEFSFANMSPNMVPRFVRLLDALPQTDTYKTDVAELTRWAQDPDAPLWDRLEQREARQ